MENVRGYLYRAAVNLSLDVIESRKRFELTATIDRFEATSEGSESRAAEEVHKRLAEAMTELPLKAVHILSLLLAMWSDHLYSRQWKNNSA